MNWLLLSCFLLWARHGEGGALKCVPDSENGSCSNAKESGPDIPDISLEMECLAGSEWVSNCHECRCSATGVADCTRQAACDLPNIVEPIRCKPSTTIQRGCNTCVCLESGLGLCTLKSCQRIPGDAPAPSKESLPAGTDCAPGTTWRSQCNDCVCSPQGLRFCTEKACPGEHLEPLLRCAPHSLWKRECNTCWCTSDGYAMCTKMGCSGIPIEMHFSDEDESTAPTIAAAEPDILEKVPDSLSNTILEPDEINFYNTTVQGIDKNNTEAVEEKLNDAILKNVDAMAHNDIETNINNAKHNTFEETLQDVYSGHNTNSKEDIQKQRENDFDHSTTDENFPQDEANTMLVLDLSDTVPYKNLEGEPHNFDNIQQMHSHKHLEEKPTLYIDQNNIKHHILKRSVCKPHQDFQDECNTCKCSATGQSYSCTQNECMDKGNEDLDKEVEVFKESEGVDHIERHTVCNPRATFFVGCNPCNCNVDGTDFSCSNKACPLPEDVEVFHELNVLKTVATPKPVIKKVCVENKMFIMNCNTCWCNEDGTSYFCTRKVCTPELPEQSPAEDKKTETTKTESTPKPATKKVCVENKMFIMNCNTCWCNDNGTSYFCTRKVCVSQLPEESAVEDGKPEKLRIIKKECRPDEVFELDCNMCHCNPDGKSFSCTRRACVDEDNKNESRSRNVRAAPQEPIKSCQPGQEFRMDCNKCLCDNEGQDFSCTRIDCNALNNNNNGGTRRKRDVSQKVPADCAPGSVFEQGCNVCRCTEDGGHATCTLKRCAQPKANATASATESSFRCNPGEQFRQSCNDCSCTADGRSVFCTIRICDEDLTP